MTKKFSTLILALAAGLSFAQAADYTQFYIFGDSLSDAGNTANPEPFNAGGRFSNGKVWNEYLAEMLDMPVPTKSDNYKAGDTPAALATNFARGGAMTHLGTATLNVPSVRQQIKSKINDKNLGFSRYGQDFAATDLVSLWAGANNLFFSGQTMIAHKFVEGGKRAAKEQADSLALLIHQGAKNIIVFNLPDIGKTPCYATMPEGAAAATAFSLTYNETLTAYLDVYEKEYPDVKMTRIDMKAIFEMLYTEPEKHGFSDYKTPLIKALTADPKVDVGKYVFYDDVHPTTMTHKFIAEQVFLKIGNGEWGIGN
ncbi:MAG: SGNH/GDSL hydrolase family protein [Akkermansia sp.]